MIGQRIIIFPFTTSLWELKFSKHRVMIRKIDQCHSHVLFRCGPINRERRNLIHMSFDRWHGAGLLVGSYNTHRSVLNMPAISHLLCYLCYTERSLATPVGSTGNSTCYPVERTQACYLGRSRYGPRKSFE